MATAVQSPSSHPHTSYRHHHHHHTFSSSTTSPSHSSATPRSTLHKHSSSYRTIGSGAGMASYSSYASSTGGARPGSSYENQPQHLHGKLHKRSISKETSVSVPSPTEEEFFPTDASSSHHHKKGIIKPLALLKKVGSSSSGSAKLDLGKENGGPGGVYYSSSSPYIGGRSSATDVASFVPTHRQQHKRTTSGTSANSNGSAPSHYARRYAPTPTQSYPNSIGGDSESADDDEDNDYVGAFGGKKSVQQQQQPLRIVTSSTGLPLALPPRIPISESAPISPVTPLGRSLTVDSIDRKRNDSIDKKRKDSIDRKRKIVGGRNSSEEYVENMKKAREKFEEQERKKEEKEERKARKSISKEDRRRSISKEESRRPSNDGTIASNPAPKSRWTFGRHSTPDLGTSSNEKTIGIPYGGGPKTAGASLRNVPIRAAEEGRRSRNEKRGHHVHGAGPRGFKNQWQGFVMWVQIGFVRMGRKVRRFFEKK
ncbi:hypothetical protein H072_4419 [Dactylellina haptotyla CBS 200.50]|uniref:Uncharacterized protein n=1 Tax=Dactylellina haptotyla (strain CBS 200.50) TaxID=1284197 RepID=S8C269_DACHA|nr:hypothetical protein H072_4419 [Dactylellina haptotyla CBS 200.50]